MNNIECIKMLKIKRSPPKLADFMFIQEFCSSNKNSVYLVKKRFGSDHDVFYVMKTINKQYIQSRPFLMRLVSRERQIMIFLDKMKPKSNSIAHLKYYFQTYHHIFLITEFIPCGSLYRNLKYISKQKSILPKLIAELIIIIDYIHNCLKITHRDLKLENIVCDQNGHLKVIDFETASNTLQQMKLICGTTSYMAPEMRLSKIYDFTVDYWALGIIIFELFTGNVYENNNDNFEFDYKLIENFKKEEHELIELLLTTPQNRATNINCFYKLSYFKNINWEKISSKKYNLFKALPISTNNRIETPEKLFETQMHKRNYFSYTSHTI